MHDQAELWVMNGWLILNFYDQASNISERDLNGPLNIIIFCFYYH